MMAYVGSRSRARLEDDVIQNNQKYIHDEKGCIIATFQLPA